MATDNLPTWNKQNNSNNRTTATTATTATDEYKTAAAINISTNAAAIKAVNPNQSTNKEFWINTVQLDGMTNINAGVLFLGSP